MKRAALILFSSLLLLTACLKAGKYETTYILKPSVQTQSVDAAVPLPGVAAYAYEVDSLDWGIASYDDAVAGILTHKREPGRRLTEPLAVAVPYAPAGDEVADEAAAGAANTASWLQFPFGRNACMVVAVDPSTRLYGYTMQQPALNLPKIYISVVFQPWREGSSYKNGNWSFYNDFYMPPTVLKSYFRPSWQAGEGDEEMLFTSSQLKAYAFVADTTDWYIASYDDAAAGRILRKQGTEERTTPNFQAYYEGDSGLFGMEVTATPLLAVAVDRVNRIYAYTKLVPDLGGEPPVWPLVFRPWRQLRRWEEAGWQFVDESVSETPGSAEPQPEEPQTDEEP